PRCDDRRPLQIFSDEEATTSSFIRNSQATLASAQPRTGLSLGLTAMPHSLFVHRMPRPVHVGLIGCGKISDAYFAGCAQYDFIKIVVCADLDSARAAAKAAEHGVRSATVDELLADPDV